MNTYWILVADAARARILTGDGRMTNLTEVEDLLNPEARGTDRDIETDAKGRYFGHGERQQGHSAEPRTDPIQHEIELFAKRVAERLDAARKTRAYERLYLVAAPKFLGLVRDNLTRETAHLVAGSLSKDVSQLSGHALEKYLQENMPT